MKDNKVFATLSGIGIIMVVAAHTGGSILNLFSNFFPYNSFFMPMFMFISGYFFKDKNVETLANTKQYIKKKFINLLLYYLIWNFIYGLMVVILYNLEIYNRHLEINLKTMIIDPFVHGQQFLVNSPAWFIPVLFTVEVAFLIIRKLQLLIKHNSEYITLLIFMIISVATVYISKTIDLTRILIPFLKLGFFIFFFQLGKMYKDKFEEKEIKIKNIYVFLITLTVNLICIKLYKDINFGSLYNMGGFGNLPSYIPIINSITGIWFWLRISRIISPVLSESKMFCKISNNTKSIMMHHICCIMIINIILYYCKGILNLDGFDVITFKNNPMWYRYYADCSQIAIVYIILEIYGSLKIADLEKKIKEWTNKVFEKIREMSNKKLTKRKEV